MPNDALARGIVMVSQETALAPDLSVAENVLLGRRLVRGLGGIDWRATRAKAAETLLRLGLHYDPRWTVRDLRLDQRQMVHIARALSMDAKVLILDEPTSSLTDDQTQALFAAIRQVNRDGVSVIFVSHRLGEVFDICDEVTVLRDGRTVTAGPIEAYDADSIVSAMVGTASEAHAEPSGERGALGRRASLLELRGVSVPGVLDDVALEVGAGEIVGLAGLVGSGRNELLEAVFGLRTLAPGATMTLAGEPHAPSSPKDSIERGVGYVPPDRTTQGLLLSMSVRENLTLVATSPQGRLRAPDGRREGRLASEVAAAMRIRMATHRSLVGTLSGGNQQKVVLGKWLAREPRLMLLDEPTRGVDVAAKAEIHDRMREAASRGVAMLVSSSEYGELLSLCDRIVVMFRGRIVATVVRAEANENKLAALAGGHR
jgi:ABC-type sugar transport system ATPase subunit